MKTIKIIACLAIPLLLMSAKCSKLEPADFISKAEKNTSYGGVYGSGYTKEYILNFDSLVTKDLTFDSIYLSAYDNNMFKKISSDRGWFLTKTEDSTYYLRITFHGGEIMKNEGKVEQVDIPTYPKDSTLLSNEGMLFIKYGKTSHAIGIKEFSKKEDVFNP